MITAILGHWFVGLYWFAYHLAAPVVCAVQGHEWSYLETDAPLMDPAILARCTRCEKTEPLWKR